MPDFECDLAQNPKPFQHFWEHTVGSGHAPLGLRADWQVQLHRCHDELGMRHVRFHGALSSPMGTLICEEEKLLYSFFNLDRIMDFLLSIGMKPFLELSFMPETLASGDTRVFRYQSNVTPPKDYAEWAALIKKLVGHFAERYGRGEVSQWFFEVWNEPNLKSFWTGSQKDYFELYANTVEAIKSVDGSFQVGGPATAQNEWIEPFLNFCEKNKLPADFVSTHYYPTDAFGQIGADTMTQLANAPRDVMRQRAETVRGQAGERPLYYTEWNISSNPRDPLHDQPFAAAYAVHILMSVSSLVSGYSFWTFSDIFEENYFPSVPFHGGFGLLNLYGIAKPVYRAFELLHGLGDGQFAVTGEHETVEVWGFKNVNTVQILLANHAQPRHPIHTEVVNIRLSGAENPSRAYIERIDSGHANPRKVWEAMGEPEYLSTFKVDDLKAASRLVSEPIPVAFNDGMINLSLEMPPHGVARVTLEFADREK
jgi:xylan 1,4-beta-xylosidase